MFVIKPAVPSWSCSKDVYKPVWHIPLLSVQWINSWWWTDELSETCRVSWQNKSVGFITKKISYDARSHDRKILRGVFLIAHLHLALRLKMSGGTPLLLLLCAFTAWVGKRYFFTFACRTNYHKLWRVSKLLEIRVEKQVHSSTDEFDHGESARCVILRFWKGAANPRR